MIEGSWLYIYSPGWAIWIKEAVADVLDKAGQTDARLSLLSTAITGSDKGAMATFFAPGWEISIQKKLLKRYWHGLNKITIDWNY